MKVLRIASKICYTVCMKYILASASPRRRELLNQIGLEFDVQVSNVEEHICPSWSPTQAVCELAQQKAHAVATQFPERCVIAADTIVVVDAQILEKPQDTQNAKRMLRLLSGREHRVITGVCLTFGAKQRVFSQETGVRFYPLSEEKIACYVATGEPMDKAGAYGIQGKGALLVESIAGDYFNVVGLPVAKLIRELEEFMYA